MLDSLCNGRLSWQFFIDLLKYFLFRLENFIHIFQATFPFRLFLFQRANLSMSSFNVISELCERIMIRFHKNLESLLIC